MDTSSYHYRSRRPDRAGLEARIKAICETRVRYGYRRVHALLQREGWRINIKNTHRIHNALGLQLRNKTPKRRVKAKLREDRCAATRPNETWAMDFVHDQLATGRKIRILTVVDPFSRFSPVIDPRFTYRSENVVEALGRACSRLGYPKAIRVDQGTGSSPGTWTCGPMPTASPWTSAGPASPLTTPSPSPSTERAGLND
jgi:putative transposase